MSHRWGRLNCVCRHCRVHKPDPPDPPAPPCSRFVRSATPRFHSSARPPTPSLRPLRYFRSYRHHNKNKIIKHCVSIALLFVIHTPPTQSPPILSGEAAEEWNRGVAQRTKREHGGASLVLRCMLLKQTPVCCNSLQFTDNTRILEITIRHPDFYNTEILLR